MGSHHKKQLGPWCGQRWLQIPADIHTQDSLEARQPPTDVDGQVVLDKEVADMLAKGAIHVVDSVEDDVISPFFARPKKTAGKWTPIVSLKYVNKHLRKIKFRMTSVKQIRNWVNKDWFFASLD